MKSILDLNSVDAKNFFLKESSYCTLNFPVYFSFQSLINAISKEIDNRRLSDFWCHNPKNFDKVNYRILMNKDGKHAWRSLQLIHPAIYVDLVNRVTREDNWNIIINRFNIFRNNKDVLCMSLPVESESEESDKAALVKHWCGKIEQRSIENSLDYEFMLQTDISNCYSSFYTHSIAWALETKEEAKNNRDENLIGNFIDKQIQRMTYGQTNGIPEGSVLMDFIAEMILGYVDLLLIEKITKHNKEHNKEYSINNYKILRFRDDYRIFANNPQYIDQIVKLLSKVLINFGMRLNPSKTIVSNNVARDSIKPDKLYWLNQKQSSESMQKELFIIHSLSEKHPNSGALEKSLTKFYNKIIKIKETGEHLTVLISIVVDIMLKNPRTYPISAAILSKLINLQENETIRKKTLERIINRFIKVPNIGHLEIWLQRMSLKLDINYTFTEKLCKKVNNSQTEIWDSEWLNSKFKILINTSSIIDDAKLSKMDSVID